MMWTVWHRWPAGARFVFNCYRRWAQLLLRQPGEPRVTILSREGVTQGYLSWWFCTGSPLSPLAKELQAADPGLLSLFYVDGVTFDGLARRSPQLLKLLMKRGPDRGYFPEPSKSLFISDTPGQEEAAKSEFAVESLTLNFVSGSRYLGAYLGPHKELESWVKPQVEAWTHGIRFLGKIARRHLQLDYSRLGMPLQIEWQ